MSNNFLAAKLLKKNEPTKWSTRFLYLCSLKSNYSPQVKPVECCCYGDENNGDDALDHARGYFLDHDEANDDDQQQGYIVDDVMCHKTLIYLECVTQCAEELVAIVLDLDNW